MFKDKVLEYLNKQIACENNAANAYLAVAAWCCINSFHGSSKFFYAQSNEERTHMMAFFDFVSQAGALAKIEQVPEPKTKFNNLLEVFEEAHAIEERTAKNLNDLADVCLQEKDYSTFSFLKTFLDEQHNEGHFLSGIIDMIKRVGDDGTGIMLIDKEVEAGVK